jgi:hypothetical protein
MQWQPSGVNMEGPEHMYCGACVLLHANKLAASPVMAFIGRMSGCACFLCLQVIDPLIAHTMELVSADSDRLSNHGCDRTYSNFHALVTINLPRLICYVVANEEDLQEEAVALYQKVCGYGSGCVGVRHSGQRIGSVLCDEEAHCMSQQMAGMARYHVNATIRIQHAHGTQQ